jgi:ribosomal protein L29
MVKEHAINEMRKMPANDLQREVQIRKLSHAKNAIGVGMGKEKNTSVLKQERRAIARMLTVLGEKAKADGLKEKPKTTTIPAPSTPKKASSKRSKQSS